ncbi:hypothetical protein [Deinococcus sp. RM]|uniref:hypothetical protein n=1 Tax=Deinococcus sp. RM TaxID=2316359 RepID=UPI0018F2C126|nr:hypothetical protein [Deinococcus sp. RM]
MRDIVDVFQRAENDISSGQHQKESNLVLAAVEPGLRLIGFQVESGKKHDQKIRVPVLFGLNGQVEKGFEADAYHPSHRFVIEVEAGRGYTNNQFLKDLFQACMMHDVDYFCVAIRLDYQGNKDFEKVKLFFDTLYASGRLQLPFKGMLLIGY